MTFSRVLLLVGLFTLGGCKVNYSFTGASIAPEIKTLSIDFFPNYASQAQPSLSQTFTDGLREIFIRQTSLTLVKQNGDLHFEGEITGYTNRPEAIAGNDVAKLNRLTITVKVRFANTKDDSQDFDRSFSQFAQYSADQNLADVEDALVAEIVERLAQDIFNASVSNW